MRSHTLRPGTSSPSYIFRLSVEIVVGVAACLSFPCALWCRGWPLAHRDTRRDRFAYRFVPTATKGPRHPQGRSELASGAGCVAALTGNAAVGASQTPKRSRPLSGIAASLPVSTPNRPKRTQIEINVDPRLRHKSPFFARGRTTRQEVAAMRSTRRQRAQDVV